MPSDCQLLKLTPCHTEKLQNQKDPSVVSDRSSLDTISNQVEDHHKRIDNLFEDLCALTLNRRSYVNRSWDKPARRRWRAKWST